jgi:hypothetical protein
MNVAPSAPVDRRGLTQDNSFAVEPIYNICTLNSSLQHDEGALVAL